MNYGISTAVPADYGIHRTNDEPDGLYVFSTFSAAKRGLIDSINRQKDDLNAALKEIRSLRLENVHPFGGY